MGADSTPLLLDGPIGTELLRRGVATPLPLWSANALWEAPEVLVAIHGDYARAGATVHTANTFRTAAWALRPAGLAERAEELTALAVSLTRRAVPAHHQVGGSMAPLEDCYRPDLSPPPGVARMAHRQQAEALRAAGVDLILCETFPHLGEARIASEEAAATGLPVWLSVTAGPDGGLLEPAALRAFALDAHGLGLSALLVNCVAPDLLLPLLVELRASGLPLGGYGNVGAPDPVQGWRSEGGGGPQAYADAAFQWLAEGASILGGCCGVGPEHIAAIADRLTRRAGA